MSPKVTVITVVYEGLNAIESTIKSVLEQTYPNLEYIVYDAGNSEGTNTIIEKYKNRITHIITGKNETEYSTMNYLVTMVSGEWVNFMKCGDTFYTSTTVQEIFEKSNDTFDILYGDYIAAYHKKGQRLIRAALPQPPHQMVLSHQSIFTRTATLQRFPFDTSLKISSDLKFHEQCWSMKMKFHYYPHVVSVRLHPGLQENNRGLAFKETESVLKTFYDPQEVKLLMQRVKLMHLMKNGAKKIMPSFLQRIYRSNK